MVRVATATPVPGAGMSLPKTGSKTHGLTTAVGLSIQAGTDPGQRQFQMTVFKVDRYDVTFE